MFARPTEFGTAYCAYGALLKVAGRKMGLVGVTEPPGRETLLLVAERTLLSVAERLDPDFGRPSFDRVVVLNDHGTHGDVMALYDLAIEEAEKGPPK